MTPGRRHANGLLPTSTSATAPVSSNVRIACRSPLGYRGCASITHVDGSNGSGASAKNAFACGSIT